MNMVMIFLFCERKYVHMKNWTSLLLSIILALSELKTLKPQGGQNTSSFFDILQGLCTLFSWLSKNFKVLTEILYLKIKSMVKCDTNNYDHFFKVFGTIKINECYRKQPIQIKKNVSYRLIVLYYAIHSFWGG